MTNLEELISNIKASTQLPGEEDLRSLPYLKAVVYGRASTQKQVIDSRESIMEIAKLVTLAKRDGYHSSLEGEQVEKWLQSIQNGDDVSKKIEDGDIFVDCRDLGLSGSLREDKRPGLGDLWRRVEAGEIGTVYLTEGMSRLSRDVDRVLGYQVLKLLKAHRCRIRTPEGIYNPSIPRDWENLADDIEDAAEEMKKMGIRLGRRRRAKATEGRHVGSPVCPGFIVEIEGQKSNGSYILGKWQPYPPHQEVVVTALKEMVRQQSTFKAARALAAKDVVFPYFPEELKYMETRSALRNCSKTKNGYRVTTNCLRTLAKNLKLIGIWQWKDVVIENNHPPIVQTDLFLQAYDLATSHSPRGKAAYTEPMDWAGLIHCYNHDQPRHVAAYSVSNRWACNQDHHLGFAPSCLYIEDHLLTPPLTKEFLRYLDLTSHAQAIMEKLKSDTTNNNLEEVRWKKQDIELRTQLANLERYLGSGNPEREETYWRLIQEVKAKIKLLGAKPPTPDILPIDIERVTVFLENLNNNWDTYPHQLRNRLLSLLIDRVELRHDRSHIEATIVWKVGFKQVVNIQRPQAHSNHENHWSLQETKLLRMLWPSASWETIFAALPNRTKSSIFARATRLRLSRQSMRRMPGKSFVWTQAEVDQMKELYLVKGNSIAEIAAILSRTEPAVEAKIKNLNIRRPRQLCRWKKQPVWDTQGFKVIYDGCTRKRVLL